MLTDILNDIFDLRYFHPDKEIEGETAIPFVWDPGNCPLVLVLGENAGGKSFFRRLVQAVAKTRFGDQIKEVIHLSMQARTGNSGMYGPARALVYGDESYNATGALTASTVTVGIRTAQGRNHDLLMYWDEPDIGMSAASAAGVGVEIREFVESLPAHIRGVFVTSHSPSLVHQLLQGKVKPHYLHLGAQKPATAADWVFSQSDPYAIAPRRPEAVSTEGHRRFKLIQKLLDSRGFKG